MRIALRTSGGRGEYELAGAHDKFVTSSLYDKQIILEVTPEITIPTGNYVRDTQGKRRIRLGDTKTDTHIYTLLAAILLLPKPKRQLSETGDGHVQIIDDHYSVLDTQFDIVQVDAHNLYIRPTYLNLANTTDSKMLDVTVRSKYVFNLWEKVNTDTSGNIATPLLQAHQAAFEHGDAHGLVASAKAIRATIDSDEDPLRQLVRKYHISSDTSIVLGIETGSIITFPDVNPATIVQSAQEAERKWRRMADRGPGGNAFRRAVKEAYNHTCLFTGLHLPITPHTGSSGVDAAHILPWAAHGINDVQNGMCLNKLCHWAFDAGILRLDFDTATNQYLISVPSYIKQHGGLTLKPFTDLEGVIPTHFLPVNTTLWPHPDYIRRLNRAIDFTS
jgi:hypothetical protein